MRSLICIALFVTGTTVACSREAEAPAPSAPPKPRPTATAPAVVLDIAGAYARGGPVAAELKVTPQGRAWRFFVTAVGIPNGAGTAADCEAVAEGVLEDGLVKATVVPFETELGSITADDLPEGGLGFVVRVLPDALVIEESTAERLCGLGSRLSGRYVRLAKMPPPH